MQVENNTSYIARMANIKIKSLKLFNVLKLHDNCILIVSI